MRPVESCILIAMLGIACTAPATAGPREDGAELPRPHRDGVGGRSTAPRGHYLPARDLIAASNRASDPRTGDATALPLPRAVRPDRPLRVVVLYYREGMRPGEETVFPPHHQVTLDATTGRVLESTPVTPAALGVARDPGVPTRGFGLDPAMTASEFWERTDRLMELSAPVWALYATGASALDEGNRNLVAEYETCFRRIAKAPLLPYYEAISGDFLAWLARVLGRR
jgi:hypothetical protein